MFMTNVPKMPEKVLETLFVWQFNIMINFKSIFLCMMWVIEMSLKNNKYNAYQCREYFLLFFYQSYFIFVIIINKFARDLDILTESQIFQNPRLFTDFGAFYIFRLGMLSY